MSIQRLFCVLGLLFCAVIAQAHDFVTERAWVEDPAGTMTLAEVQQAPATAFDNKYFTRGFSRSTFWLRLRIDPNASSEHPAADKLVIRIRPPYQDQVRLYDPLADQDRIRQTGDYFDWAGDEYRSLNLNFVIPVGESPRDVWLRLRTDQSTMTVIEVMTEDETRAADRRQEIAMTLYLAVLLVCMGWGSLNYFNHRDELVGSYVFRELLAIAYALIMLGYFRVFTSGWLPVHLVDPVSNIVIWFFVAYVIWFDTRLIREFKPHPWLTRVLRFLPWVFPLNMLLFVVGKLYLANIVNAYLVIFAIFLIMCAALSTRAWKEAQGAPADEQPVFSKAFLLTVYGTVLLVVLVNRLPIMGFMSAQDGFLYLNLVYAVLSSIAMMVLIQVRTSRLHQRQQDAQRRLEVAELEAEQERAQRIEQANFLKMLAHEMKTPLSVVRMAIGRGEQGSRISDMADRAVQDMNGIIERLLDVEKLNDQQLKVLPVSFDLIDLIHKIRDGLPEGQRLRLDAPQQLMMQSDVRFIQVILSNLFENAIKYGAVDAPIDVRIRQTSGRIAISVCNPVGASGAPDPAQVFNKYYRAPGAHERTGSGLGLYLVNAMVSLLAGSIRYQASGGVICFDISLPVATA